MPLSSRWLDSLERQFQAYDSAYPETEAVGASVSPDTLGSTSGLSAVPQAAGSSFMERLGAGASQGGLAGALLSFAADPNADRSATGSNAFDALTGITRSLGRAIGSAYGNPGFALAARAQDEEAALGRERIAAYQQQVDQQLEASMEARREKADKRAREARAVAALQGIDPRTPEGNREAVARLTQLGEIDAAAKVAGMLPKAEGVPSGYRQTESGDLAFIPGGPADPSVARTLGDARRRAPGGGASGGGGGGVAGGKAPSGYRWTADGSLEPIPGGPADKPGSGVAGDAGLQRSTRAKLEQENISLERDLARLDESIESFDPSLYTWSGRAGRSLKGVASSAGVLSEKDKSSLQGETTNIQRLQMVSAELINKLYGAALSEAEAKRAETFVVNPTDAPDVAQAKLRGLRDMYAAKLEANRAALGGGNGSPAPAAAPPPAEASIPAGAEPTGRTSGGKPVYKLPDGRLWTP